ncbi:LOW QUALITY PROTEIN: WW domain-binding protein 11-like [Tachyglossus aculeatus]|uniref:LOW QUALITY PROTEIN: WW domain-binding protein 11-like n=1 Tax=Tachyglossus aculeatus TaxID=9261 RepID=UPI0018F30F15|nr:LOW QUALITY PROTEIN: WW domain-binding protein 11-like [Tachyglossus aculeatus]
MEERQEGREPQRSWSPPPPPPPPLPPSSPPPPPPPSPSSPPLPPPPPKIPSPPQTSVPSLCSELVTLLASLPSTSLGGQPNPVIPIQLSTLTYLINHALLGAYTTLSALGLPIPILSTVPSNVNGLYTSTGPCCACCTLHSCCHSYHPATSQGLGVTPQLQPRPLDPQVQKTPLRQGGGGWGAQRSDQGCWEQGEDVRGKRGLEGWGNLGEALSHKQSRVEPGWKLPKPSEPPASPAVLFKESWKEEYKEPSPAPLAPDPAGKGWEKERKNPGSSGPPASQHDAFYNYLKYLFQFPQGEQQNGEPPSSLSGQPPKSEEGNL